LYIEKSLMQYALDTRSSDPTPGGGSVSAYVATLGSALTSMVGGLTFGKKSFQEVPEKTREEMETKAQELEKLFDELAEIVDRDTTAFDKVMAAFKLPKDTEEEKKTRSKAIQEGYREALEVPLGCAKKCHRVLELQGVFAENGNVNAITDIGVGILLVHSGLEGALLNVTINLGSIKDENYREEVSAQVTQLLSTGKILKEQGMEMVYRRLEG